jgi:hypothetical protein
MCNGGGGGGSTAELTKIGCEGVEKKTKLQHP